MQPRSEARIEDFAVFDQLDTIFKAIEAAWTDYLKKGLPKGIKYLKDVPEIKEPIQRIRKAITQVNHYELKIALITQMDGKISLPIAILIFEEMRLANLERLNQALTEQKYQFAVEEFDKELKSSFEHYIYGGTFGSGASLKELEGDTAVRKFITDKVLEPFFKKLKVGDAEKKNLTQLLLRHIYLTCSVEVYIRSDLWQNDLSTVEKEVALALGSTSKCEMKVRKPYTAICKLAEMPTADEMLKPLSEESAIWLRGLYYRIYNLVKPGFRVNGNIVPSKDGYPKIDPEDEKFFRYFNLTKAQVSEPHRAIANVFIRKFQGVDNFSLEIFEEFSKQIMERGERKLSELVHMLNMQPPKARSIQINRSGSSIAPPVSISPDLSFLKLPDGGTEIVLRFSKAADPDAVRNAERKLAQEFTPQGKPVDPDTLPDELQACAFEGDKRKKCNDLATAIAKYQLTEYQIGCLSSIKKDAQTVIGVYRKWSSSYYYMLGLFSQANTLIIDEFEKNINQAKDPREQLQVCLKCCEQLAAAKSKNILPLFYAFLLGGDDEISKTHNLKSEVFQKLLERRPVAKLGFAS